MKIKDVCFLQNGRAFKPSDWSEGGLPIIRIQNLNDYDAPFNFYSGEYSDVHEINNGDLLFSWSGTPGTSFGAFSWNRGKGILNQHIFKVIPIIDVDKEYLKYALNGNIKTIIAKAHGGVGLQHITKKELDDIEIPIVNIDKQLKIVKILSKVNNLIALHKYQLEKLDLLIKARFVEMFGEPFMNPYHWDIVRIGDIVTDVRYGTSRPAVDNGKFLYLRMNNLTYNGTLDLTDVKRIDIPEDEIDKCIVCRGDVLFNRTNSTELVGKTCVFNESENMVIAGYIIRLRLKENVLPVFLSCYMNTRILKKYLRNIAKGAVNQANINAKELQAISIYLPPIELQTQFAAFVEAVDKSKVAVQKALDEAQLLFDSLMQEYFG